MLKFLVSSLSQQSASPHGGFFAVASDTSKPLNLSMVLMSCDDMNKFLFDCVVIASYIHKFFISVVIASA